MTAVPGRRDWRPRPHVLPSRPALGVCARGAETAAALVWHTDGGTRVAAFTERALRGAGHRGAFPLLAVRASLGAAGLADWSEVAMLARNRGRVVQWVDGSQFGLGPARAGRRDPNGCDFTESYLAEAALTGARVVSDVEALAAAAALETGPGPAAVLVVDRVLGVFEVRGGALAPLLAAGLGEPLVVAGEQVAAEGPDAIGAWALLDEVRVTVGRDRGALRQAIAAARRGVSAGAAPAVFQELLHAREAGLLDGYRAARQHLVSEGLEDAAWQATVAIVLRLLDREIASLLALCAERLPGRRVHLIGEPFALEEIVSPALRRHPDARRASLTGGRALAAGAAAVAAGDIPDDARIEQRPAAIAAGDRLLDGAPVRARRRALVPAMSAAGEGRIGAALAAARAHPSPWPHLIVEQALTGDFYEQIRRMLPPVHLYRARGRRAAARRSPCEVFALPDAIELLDATRARFWRALCDWARDELAVAVVEKLAPLVPGLERGAHYRLEGELARTTYGHWSSPHTDEPSKALTILLYLPPDDRWESCGTALYAPSDPALRCAGGVNHDRRAFTRVTTVPFRRNTLLAFAPGEDTFHGVEPIDDDAERDVLVLFFHRTLERSGPC